ncbi:fungal-specific transcription factor domain-containing protein [Aspergillus avenaceus]|uniref:Fungal-specific transcription factor domain-containing protein n=1 Tax=Aspergillus avenaceus TaxID=36643 RepID=A0A5N6TJP9_ASPAV|nr:fungal-specific transcription factor domain-containing protein [Aspergillus avenaceus]
MPPKENSRQSTQLVAIAPAPNSTSPASNRPPSKTMPYNCQSCVRRKVKCDRIKPSCSACRSRGLECVYQAPAPPRKRKRPSSEDIHDRLARYERLLQENGLLSSPENPSSSPFEPPKSKCVDSRASRGTPLTGKLLSEKGKSRYIDSRVWLDATEVGIHELSVTEEGQDPPGNCNTPTEDPLSAALLGTRHNLSKYHPSHEDALKLWAIYVENVEPICKVLHVPTATGVVSAVSQQPTTASKTDECLVFAIYHFAVYSMSDEDCQRTFTQPRTTLLSRYQAAVRHALVNASWLKTAQLPVLQAYVLFLTAIRNQTDPHSFWIWTGVAVRLAQRMGLHRDVECLGLSPFDVEMRRRLFWQLGPLDGYAGQMSGTGISISPDNWDTQPPRNLNDNQLYPGMTAYPEEQKGASEMIFFLAKTELSRLYNRTGVKLVETGTTMQPKDILILERLVDEVENVIECKYLRYCDIINPLHFLTLGVVRYALNMVRLRTRSSPLMKQIIDDEQRMELCTVAQSILDTDCALFANPNLKQFHWHVKTFFLWDALICILTSLGKVGFFSPPDRTQRWHKIAEVYSNRPGILESRDGLHSAVCKVTLKAWEANPPDGTIDEPTFITTLRSRSEVKVYNKVDATQNAGSIEVPYPFDALFDPPNSVDLNFDEYLNLGAAEWLWWD